MAEAVRATDKKLIQIWLDPQELALLDSQSGSTRADKFRRLLTSKQQQPVVIEKIIEKPVKAKTETDFEIDAYLANLTRSEFPTFAPKVNKCRERLGFPPNLYKL